MPADTVQAQSAEEKEWAAKSDARTLAEANVILNDDSRFKAAQKAAKNLAKEAKADFEAMLRVAGKGKTVEGMRVLDRQ